MKAYNIRELECHCDYCKTATKMEVTRQGPSDDSYWLKCKRCKMSTLISADELKEYGIKAKQIVSDNGKVKIKRKSKSEKPVHEYAPEKKFLKGQIVYHPEFDDTGTIKKIKTGTGRFDKIVVKFEKSGERILIHDVT